MITKILNEAQKLMTKNGKKRQAHGNQDFTEAAVDTLTKREIGFSCIYCYSQNIEEYHTYRKAVELNPYPSSWTPTPYLSNWDDFRLHLEIDHPEQWGRSEIDPVGPQGMQTWNDAQGRRDSRRITDIYLNIRAYPEYGWNPFILIRKPGSKYPTLWCYRHNTNPTLMGLPEDITTIVGVTWIPRTDPSTGKLWEIGTWQYEKEARTHTRAQNAVGPQVNRSLNSVRRKLRGAKGHATNLSDGCTLVRNEEVDGHFAIDLTDVSYKSLYTVNCLLHKRALSAVSAKRLRLGVEGQGNIGQLQAVQRWQASGIPSVVLSNGIVVKDEKEIVALAKEAERQATEDTNTTDKEQETVESPTASINEDTTVAVEQTVQENSQSEQSSVDLDLTLAELHKVLPSSEYFENIYNDVEYVFAYAKRLKEQSTSWTVTNLQERVNTLTKNLAASKANALQFQSDWKQASDNCDLHLAQLEKLGENPVSATTHAKITQEKTALQEKVDTLQKQLAERPVSARDQIAAVGKATVNKLDKQTEFKREIF